MRIYTRGGDKGETSLIYGRRIAKDHLRVETYGAVDEANAVLGVAAANLTDAGALDLCSILTRVQRDLFDVGRDLATPEEKRADHYVTGGDVALLERLIDDLDARLPPLTRFVLPGGTPAAAHLHHARTVVRRAERRVVSLAKEGVSLPIVQQYLNRLSDLLFVLARTVNHRLQHDEPGVDFQAPKPEVILDDKTI
ncbi:cob(I)yrinic acid a,c-diamide adenosyltransferase [Alicyclobacillus fastidiosus]|uniref:Corrinoid adenosyltransferase n=1 Tax=Alicyclobacillus fastidiosus TaxID=392011 RepID=A0ABY6ZPK9_9BACL|nr:cob(I)yrinic acid a,c-diamide adenosyltransferase [Alicyclobacillus fastidiosus]WAH44009.1 cob(I)yrinic acid a,c-diamide adenosyltransferase [Alicyclobacillus fastidiosus]GMA60291.1 ATP--cob(I)alamin adenosyltransferase [Alicyclobacillus fastidiosus]